MDAPIEPADDHCCDCAGCERPARLSRQQADHPLTLCRSCDDERREEERTRRFEEDYDG